MNGIEPQHTTEQPTPDPAALRRQTVDAVAHAKQLRGRRQAAADLAALLEELAIRALDEDPDRVRAILDRRVEALKQEESLADQLRTAAGRARSLKTELLDS